MRSSRRIDRHASHPIPNIPQSIGFLYRCLILYTGHDRAGHETQHNETPQEQLG
jgi:hypothetical protein